MFINVNHCEYFTMKSAVVFMAVLFSSVPIISTDSDLDSKYMSCYQCDPYKLESCSTPHLARCWEDNKYCYKATMNRGDEESIYACVTRLSENCGWYFCQYCKYDVCNKPGVDGAEYKLRRCWEKYEDRKVAPPFFKLMERLSFVKRYCGIDQQCMVATTRTGERTYYGCAVLLPEVMCKTYNFDTCKVCDGELCNKPEGLIDNSLTCYECYEGDTDSGDKTIFRGFESCKNPTKRKCNNLDESCVRGIGNTEGRRYYGCSFITNNSVNDFNTYTICSSNLCNKVRDESEDRPSYKCYECYSGGTNDNFKNMTLCSNPSKKQCDRGLKCVTASSQKKRYHGCAEENKFCKEFGFDECKYCYRNLCNEVSGKLPSTPPEPSKPSKPPKQRLECYECFTSVESNPKITTVSLCSRYQSIKLCKPDEICTQATNKSGNQFYGCLPKTNDTDAECKILGYEHCIVCKTSLCNKVTSDSRDTSSTRRRISSALAVTSNSLLIILIVFHAVLYIYEMGM